MITPSFGLTATERVLPRLALDFTTASLDPRITFTRTGNTATVINSSGVITSINANLPRFDYTLKTGGACKGLLIEETRINFLTSVDLVNPTSTTGWTKTGDAASTFTVVSDSTELTAAGLATLCTAGNVYKLDNSAGTTNAFVNINTAVTWGLASVSLSAYMRGSGTARLETNQGTWTPVNHTLTSVYQRYVTVGTTDTSSNQFRVRALAGSVVYFILVQAEVGAFATSLIPNTGSAVTRNADNASMTGTNFSSWYNATEGTFVVRGNIPSTGGATRRLLSANDNTTDNSIQLAMASGGTSGYFEARVLGSTVVSASVGTVAVNNFYNYSLGYKLNNYAYTANASSPGTDTSADVPTINQLSIGYHTTSSWINGYIAKILYFPQRLTNAEIQAQSK